MPRIRLKDRSPEFEGSSSSFHSVRTCEHGGCTNVADYKAPKHRGLNDHYHFCLEHVQAYNRSWNFFEGMSDEEVLEQINRDRYGDRPTWKYATYAEAEEYIRQRSWDNFRAYEDVGPGSQSSKKDRDNNNSSASNESTEFKAMAIMGLSPPITFPEIKKIYRQLVKKYHPDLNQGCKKAEDRLKEINMAYTVLKGAYEKYDKLVRKHS